MPTATTNAEHSYSPLPPSTTHDGASACGMEAALEEAGEAERNGGHQIGLRARDFLADFLEFLMLLVIALGVVAFVALLVPILAGQG